MRISIPVNHNYYEELPIIGESSLCSQFSVKDNRRNKEQLRQFFSSVYELKLGAKQLKQVKVFNFKRNRFLSKMKSVLF